MSLPPYNHTRNPALEKENEYQEYPAPSVPLITHSGVIEKRKTTDRNLIRNQPPHAEVEFEYLPVFSSSGSTMGSSKRNCSKMKKSEKTTSNREKNRNDNCCSHIHNDEMKIDKPLDNDKELTNEMSSKSENNENTKQKYAESICSDRTSSSKHSKRSVRTNRESSIKLNASNESLCSKKSAKSTITHSSVTSTIKDVINDNKNNRRALSTTEFRRIANGLDEEDLFPHRRR